MVSTRLEVHGLPDDDAAAQLEKILLGKTGIPKANIDVNLHIAEITYDEDLVSAADIVNWIRSAGYDARFAGESLPKKP